MSVSGHFTKSLPELRMPKPEEWAAELRFRAQGPILTGRVSPELALARDAATVAKQQIASSLAAGTPPGYVQPQDYDPVLRFHCRMGKQHY
jgi:hypothetical protein